MTGGAPTSVVEVLRSRPDLAERVAEAALRSAWTRLSGEEAARHTEPLSLREGVLTVGVASSPWLHHLTLLEGDLRRRLDRLVGPGVIREVRFQLRARTRGRTPPAPHPPQATLSPEDTRAIEQALAPIGDPALAAVLRRLMVKACLSKAREGGGPRQ